VVDDSKVTKSFQHSAKAKISGFKINNVLIMLLPNVLLLSGTNCI